VLALSAACGEERRPEDPPARADGTCEHGLPPELCTRCNPALEPVFRARGDWCEEHDFPESICPTCNPGAAQAAAAAPGAADRPVAIQPGTRIRFRSPELERAAGIRTADARDAAVDIGVDCTARIDFDGNRVADVRAPVPGIVREVLVDVGQPVESGAPLFSLESPDVVAQQTQIRAARERVEAARANDARQRELMAAGIGAARNAELASQELAAAEADLRALQSGLALTGASRGGRGRYVIRATLPGVVVRRPATLGTFASAETSLALIADTARMWALLDVREADAAAVASGQPVTVTVDGAAGRAFEGRITWVAAEVDPRTRTVAARAELDNPDGVLRAGQFARATVRVAAPERALAVPRAAVQRHGDQSVVFVRTAPGLYEPRPVELGRSNGELVQVTGELAAGDDVVTDGAYLLKTELSIESIGAGCCEVEPPGG
jgi:cobalt-zinc-cadmium efflux system membrane fusion protein